MLTVLLAAALMLGHTAASNFSTDLVGVDDTRPDTWGTTAAQAWRMQFHPPAGKRVRIKRVTGDMIAHARILPGDTPVPEGAASDVLVGMQSTAAGGSSSDCTPCGTGTLLYFQGTTGRAPVRIPFDLALDYLLEPDGVLLVKAAKFLDTTGKAIHVEVSFTVAYEFE